MPKIVDKDEKRGVIALSAFNLFCEKGLRGTTIKDIAEAAGISKGLVYQYFSSKNDIIKYVTEFMWREAEERIQQSMTFKSDETSALSVIIDEISAFWDNDFISLKKMTIVYTEIYLLNLRDELLEVKEVFEKIIEVRRILIRDTIDSGKTAGIFREECDPDAMAVMLCASLDGIGMHYVYNPDRFNMYEAMNDFMDIFLESLLTKKGKAINKKIRERKNEDL